MTKHWDVLKNSSLFKGEEEKNVEAMLGCLSATVKSYAKGNFILRAGETTDYLGILLDGGAHIIREDFWGNRNIIAAVEAGEVFAEAYACSPDTALEISVLANEASTVMFLDVQRILTVCSSACKFHTDLIRRLLFSIAENNLKVTGKLSHVTQRSTRDKLLSYLSTQAVQKGSASFTIPFNRQQLADYLSVDRSAMSGELSKMRKEGLLSYVKNSFTLCGN